MTLSAPTLLAEAAYDPSPTFTTYNLASVSATANSIVQVFVASPGAASPSSVSHPQMGSFFKFFDQPIPNSNLSLSVWQAIGAAGSGSVTITWPSAIANANIKAIQATSNNGMPTLGDTGYASNAVSGTTVAYLDYTPPSTSCTVTACVYNAGSAQTANLITGFTALGSRLQGSGPANQMMLGYKINPPLYYGGFDFSNNAGKVVYVGEIEDAVVSGPSVKLWNGTSEVNATLSLWNGTSEVSLTQQLAP